MKLYIPNVAKQKEYNLLAGHFIPVHNRQVDYDWLKNLNAFVNKIVGGPVDVQQVSRMFSDSPNSNILLRDHPLSEQKDDIQQDPAGTGKRHANEMIANYEKMAQQAKERNLPFPSKEQIILIGANEPNVSGGDRNHMKYEDWLKATEAQCAIIDIYTANFLDTLTERGYIGGALNLSVGWPSNIKDNEPSYWGWFERTHQAILRGKHYLILHEYWADDGPDYMWGWWAGRFTHCTWQVPIIIGEAGIDQYVKDGVDIKDTRGYKGRPISHETYVAQIKRYLELVSRDKRIVAVMLYTSDCNHRDWGSFDLEPIYHLLSAIKDIYKVVPGNIQFKPTQPNKPPVNTSPEQKMYVVANLLNIRMGPGIEYDVIDQIALNAEVKVHETMADRTGQYWARIGPNHWASLFWLNKEPFKAPEITNTSKILVNGFARMIGAEEKVMQAIFAIESGNQAYWKEGKPIIRFENHIFYTKLNNPTLYYKHFTHGTPQWEGHMWRKDENSEWEYFHGNQAKEWKVFEFATNLDRRAAIESTSYGIGQIMGFNFKRVGFSSPEELFEKFSQKGEEGLINQVMAFCAYIYNTEGLIQAIKEKNWYRIAELYNGVSSQAASYALQMKNTYSTL